MRIYNDAAMLSTCLSSKAWSLVMVIEKYVNGASLQWHRMQEIPAEFERLMAKMRMSYPEDWEPPAKPKPPQSEAERWQATGRMFVELHFFLICGDKVHGAFESLVRLDDDPAVRQLWKRKKARLEQFRDERDSLEHIDEEITRGTFDLGNLRNDTYSFGGREFDIGPKALATLTDTHEELVTILRGRVSK